MYLYTSVYPPAACRFPGGGPSRGFVLAMEFPEQRESMPTHLMDCIDPMAKGGTRGGVSPGIACNVNQEIGTGHGCDLMRGACSKKSEKPRRRVGTPYYTTALLA